MATMAEALEACSDTSIKHIVNISGGKDSTALAIHLKNNYPNLPAEYVFCDTGCELPETYEYLEKLEILLGKPVIRIDALDLLNIEKKPGRNPFDIWLREVYGSFLPSPRMRWCTRTLKIQPFEKYVGAGRAYSYIGIRYDENREGYVSRKPPVISDKPNIMPVYPFKEDKIGLAQVTKILEESGIGFPKYYEWRSRSGCYFCFYQQIGEWQGLKEHHAELFEKAKQYEKTKGSKRYTWVEGRTLDDIAALERRAIIPKSEDEDGCAICHL
jgi:3'-phosphoadenosine 5'-phosphosulfate sulfotransferase (PAPS reductase)/FAD synthetase